MATTYLRTSGGILRTASGVVGIEWANFPETVVVYAPNIGGIGTMTITKAISHAGTGQSSYNYDPIIANYEVRYGTSPWFNVLRLAITSDGHLCWRMILPHWYSGYGIYYRVVAIKDVFFPYASPYGVFQYFSQSRNFGAENLGPYTIKRADDDGSTVTITTSSPLPSTINGTPYSQSLAASGGTSPYTWSKDSGTLPAGITLSTAGVLSGTPTETATFTATFRATDSNGYMGSKAFTP
jgi:hypothetical protein